MNADPSELCSKQSKSTACYIGSCAVLTLKQLANCSDSNDNVVVAKTIEDYHKQTMQGDEILGPLQQNTAYTAKAEAGGDGMGNLTVDTYNFTTREALCSGLVIHLKSSCPRNVFV